MGKMRKGKKKTSERKKGPPVHCGLAILYRLVTPTGTKFTYSTGQADRY
jgi:hypothetical protein